MFSLPLSWLLLSNIYRLLSKTMTKPNLSGVCMFFLFQPRSHSPITANLFELTPFPHLTPLPSGSLPCRPLKPLTEVINKFLIPKFRGHLSIIVKLLAPNDWYLRLQGLLSPMVAGLPFVLCLPFPIPISNAFCYPSNQSLQEVSALGLLSYCCLSLDLVFLPLSDDTHTFVSSQTS